MQSYALNQLDDANSSDKVLFEGMARGKGQCENFLCEKFCSHFAAVAVLTVAVVVFSVAIFESFM